MSVYCDKIIGYAIKLPEDLYNMDNNIMDKYIYNKSDIEGYVEYREAQKGDITIAYDGLSGQDHYLVYILRLCRNTEECFDDCIMDEINKQFEKIEIPEDILGDILVIHEKIFGEQEVSIEDVKLKYFMHWH